MDFDPLFEDVYSGPVEELNENNNPEAESLDPEETFEDSSEETGTRVEIAPTQTQI